MAKFLRARSAERSPATAAKDRAQIVALWTMAARRGLVDKWPEVRRIRVPERVPEAWTIEQLRLLLDEVALEKAVISGIPAPLWWRALLLVCYDTAERITAVRSLEWQDVSPDSVVFRAESRKGGLRDIRRPIGRATAKALDLIREPKRDLVFPWPYTPAYLWGRMGIILRRAGLPADRRSKFHRIRRTTASFYAAAGHSATALLDHSSPAVTRRYLDPRIVRGVAAPDVLPAVG